jgi:hypothetical protein
MPYATTLFDYPRRAMPYTSPGSLSVDEIHAVSVYILAEGRVIEKSTVLDAKSLLKIEMPTATCSSAIRGRKRSSSNWRDKFGIAGSPGYPADWFAMPPFGAKQANPRYVDVSSVPNLKAISFVRELAFQKPAFMFRSLD